MINKCKFPYSILIVKQKFFTKDLLGLFKLSDELVLRRFILQEELFLSEVYFWKHQT